MMKTCSFFEKAYETAYASMGCSGCASCKKDFQGFQYYCTVLDIPSAYIKLNVICIPYISEKGLEFKKSMVSK